MNECLLCAKKLTSTPSWKAIVGLEEQMIICLNCSKMFQRAEIKEEDTILDQVTSLYTYNEAMKDYLHQYKFLQDVALSAVFAKELKPHLKKEAIIVPIPMHPEKRIARTFAHVDELLKSARVPYTHLLTKTDTESMGEKSKAERLAMKPLFTLKKQVVITQGTYLLVDDIYTTGTTLRHAATILKEAGATRVEAVTLMRTERQLN